MTAKNESLNLPVVTKKVKGNKLFSYKKHERWILGSILPIILIIVWDLAGRAGLVEAYLLPTPTRIIQEIFNMAIEGTLFGHIGITLGRVAVGFTFGTLFAVILGSAVGYFNLAEKIMDPLIQAFRSIPALAWVPLFILWMGIGESSKVTLIAVGVFFPVYINVVAGIRGVDRKLIEVGKIYGFTSGETLRRILLPAALPSFFTGLRTGVGLGWMFVVAAEIMGASKGLGYLLIVGQNTYSPELIIASIVLFAVIGKATDSLLKKCEKKLLGWQDSLSNQL